MQALAYAGLCKHPGLGLAKFAEAGPIQQLVQDMTAACERAGEYFDRHGNYEGANETWGVYHSRADNLIDRYERPSRQSSLALLLRVVAHNMSKQKAGDLEHIQYSLTNICELAGSVLSSPGSFYNGEEEVLRHIVYQLTPLPRKLGPPQGLTGTDDPSSLPDNGNVVPFPIPRRDLYSE